MSALFFFLSCRYFVAFPEEDDEESGGDRAGTQAHKSRRHSQEALALEMVAVAERG